MSSNDLSDQKRILVVDDEPDLVDLLVFNLQKSGYLTVDGDHIRLNRDGLLQVDRLLHEFFLPEHRNARYT